MEVKEETLEQKPAYQVKLDSFTGPLDLLLELIKKEEMDIYNIEISKITQQYVEYLKLIKELDIELAGEFIVMAATLIYIKSRMLVPDATGEDEEDGIDPRAELVRQLIEYKKYKEISEEFKRMETRQSYYYYRADMDLPENVVEEYKEVTLFELISSFKRVIENYREAQVREIKKEEVSVELKIQMIMDKLSSQDGIEFVNLFSSAKSRKEIIATFLAMLELVKGKQIIIKQSKSFDSIWIFKRNETFNPVFITNTNTENFGSPAENNGSPKDAEYGRE